MSIDTNNRFTLTTNEEKFLVFNFKQALRDIDPEEVLNGSENDEVYILSVSVADDIELTFANPQVNTIPVYANGELLQIGEAVHCICVAADAEVGDVTVMCKCSTSSGQLLELSGTITVSDGAVS